ncbi:ribosomal-processing cysteine protease Prp [Spiroplasma endosymbiont of Labia minor]|uniref:ribosomal-processing cysteine protease Prp n=1 Tax=Spiroplasma endosymbiont of Labia minor TaxID=3066305 RepID=UPI0030CB66F7
MIKVNISKKGSLIDFIKISGHAKFGDYGQDLVCAGVTAITSGTLNALDTLFAGKTNIKIKDNLIEIDVLVSSEELQLLFQLMIIQLKTIEVQYKENLKIKEV